MVVFLYVVSYTTMPFRQGMSFSKRFLLFFFVAVFSFLCLISSGVLDSEDGWLYASVARNIYYHHQLAAAPDEYPELNVHMNTVQGADGVWRAPGSLGYSLSLVPAVFLSDLVHRAYQVSPPEHFPLQHDWSFHLFASFTNAFYGALFALILLLYAHELGFSARYSVLISVLTLTATSLLALTKFSFAHMMFVSFLMVCFYSIKKFSLTHQVGYLVLAALSFGLVALSYNQTYYLVIIPLGVYLLMLETPVQRRWTLALGAIGGIVALFLFRHTLFSLILITVNVSFKMLLEGVWGFLFSPGKSIFLYTPPLLLIPLFWHKIKPHFKPELVAIILMTIFYLYVLGSATITKNGMLQPIWHGGMNWGTRYISPLIPLWMLIVFHIIQYLKSYQKKLIVVPLFMASIWVQLIGITTPYLLQYIDLPYNFYIAKSEILVYDYASFIPRYTPLLALSKQFVKRVIEFPVTVNRGQFNVRLFDGFDPPLRTATGPIRGFREEGYISFSDSSSRPVRSVDLELYNAPDVIINGITTQISVSLNGQELEPIVLPSQGTHVLQLSFSDAELQGRNELIFKASYPTKLLSPQVIYIKHMKVNDQLVNLGSLDYPDMSNLGSKTSSIPYRYTGAVVTDQWAFWQMRARVSERAIDFWWVKNLYFWDKPNGFIWGLFASNVLLFLVSGLLTAKMFRNLKD